jgi:hypothetical protein
MPDVGEDWTHAAGSEFHCDPNDGWYGDCWAPLSP